MKQRFGRRKRALHLVVNDARPDERRVEVARFFEFQMMPFALKGFARQERMKNRVGIDLGQVPKVAFERGANGINRPQTARHRVDEAGWTGFNHLEKRLAHGKAFASGQNRVFEDVRNTVIGIRRRGKGEGEAVFGVARFEMKQAKARRRVFKFAGVSAKLRQLDFAQKLKIGMLGVGHAPLVWLPEARERHGASYT